MRIETFKEMARVCVRLDNFGWIEEAPSEQSWNFQKRTGYAKFVGEKGKLSFIENL
jgi:hypothetical protein